MFAGSPAVALPALRAVAAVADELAVISQPDKPVGRKKILTPTPVSQWAADHGVTLFRPQSNDELANVVARVSPDLGITVAYGRILKPDVLAMPDFGWWNLHFSLLPRWRGAAPVQNALLAGDTETGVTIFALDDGVDTGPLLAQTHHRVVPGITAGELLGELAERGATLTGRLLATTPWPPEAKPQTGDATHAPKLDRQAGQVRQQHSLEHAYRSFQATTPEPGCFFTWGDARHSLGIISATAVPDSASPGDGSIRLVEGQVAVRLTGGNLVLHTVHPAGKKPMAAADWWRGVHEDVVIDG